MRRVPLTLFAVALQSFTAMSVGIAQRPTIYGSYQDCPFHCRTIQINSNHTFEYRLNGDLYNNERYQGTWAVIGRNKLRARTPVDRTPLEVIEKPKAGANDYSIIVLDTNGAIVRGAVISSHDRSGPFCIVSDVDPVHIPVCWEFELSFNGYHGSYRILDSSAREFEVRLHANQILSTAIDETWLIEGNRLYVAAPDGTFHKKYWLDKLPRAKTRKIVID